LSLLAPHLSRETIEFHYGKHHAGYVSKLNTAVKGTTLEKKSLQELIQTQKGKIFNLAAQIWNHTFYWRCLKPGGGNPSRALEDLLVSSFGSVANFKKQFTTVAADHFGSGWAWLVQKRDGSLAIYSLPDAETPLTLGHTPLLTCDVWEHAYYIDHKNNRNGYIDAWWNVVNWDFVATNLKLVFTVY